MADAGSGFGAMPPEPKGWWARNWRWFVPVSVLGLLLCCCGGPLLVGGGVFAALKSTEPYKEALRIARDDPRVVEALGSPVEEGWLLQGNVNRSGAGGNANLHIPVSGPDGEGTVHVVAVRESGEWRLTTLTFDEDGPSETIDLLE